MEEQYYRVVANINLDNIYKNVCSMKNNILPKTQMVAVIKADGYGHGAVPIAKTVDSMMAAYAVATVDEAINLRKNGITKPIYILGFSHNTDFMNIINMNIIPAVFELSIAKELSEYAVKEKKTASINIKIDTGMNRIGFKPNDKAFDDIISISKLPNIRIEGIFTHFVASDSQDKKMAEEQLKSFVNFYERLEAAGVKIPIKHCSNSAGIIDMKDANLNEVRAGISLYGLYPSDEVNKKNVPLYPAMEIKSHVVYLKEVMPNEGISYGSTYIAKENMLVATIPVGYGDGYPRNLSNKGYVLIRGQKAPIVGRVCMDQFMVDVTNIKNVSKEDEVTLIGNDGKANISVEEISELAGTFNYEFVCDIGKRVPRAYYRNGKLVCKKDYFTDIYNMIE